MLNLCDWIIFLLTLVQTRDWQIFSVKGQIINILVFADHMWPAMYFFLFLDFLQLLFQPFWVPRPWETGLGPRLSPWAIADRPVGSVSYRSSLFLLFFHKALVSSISFALCVCCAEPPQWCPILCNPVDCNPPSSSVHWILQARVLEWVAMPLPGDVPGPGNEPRSLMSPALAGRFFNISTIWEAHFLCSTWN